IPRAAAYSPLLIDLRDDKEQAGECQVFASPLARIQIGGVVGQFALQVAHIHGSLVPFKPEAEGAQAGDLIFGAGVGLKTVPAMFPIETSRAAHPAFPPTQVSRKRGQASEKVIDADRMRKLIEKSAKSPLLKRSRRSARARQAEYMPIRSRCQQEQPFFGQHPASARPSFLEHLKRFFCLDISSSLQLGQ